MLTTSCGALAPWRLDMLNAVELVVARAKLTVPFPVTSEVTFTLVHVATGDWPRGARRRARRRWGIVEVDPAGPTFDPARVGNGEDVVAGAVCPVREHAQGRARDRATETRERELQIALLSWRSVDPDRRRRPVVGRWCRRVDVRVRDGREGCTGGALRRPLHRTRLRRGVPCRIEGVNRVGVGAS